MHISADTHIVGCMHPENAFYTPVYQHPVFIHNITIVYFQCVYSIVYTIFVIVYTTLYTQTCTVFVDIQSNIETSKHLQCVAVCCSVLQCVAVCCSVFRRHTIKHRNKQTLASTLLYRAAEQRGIKLQMQFVHSAFLIPYVTFHKLATNYRALLR